MDRPDPTPSLGTPTAWAVEWALLALLLVGGTFAPVVVAFGWDLGLPATLDLLRGALAQRVAIGVVSVALAGAALGVGSYVAAAVVLPRAPLAAPLFGVLTAPVLAVAVAVPSLGADGLGSLSIGIAAQVLLALPSLGYPPVWLALRARGVRPPARAGLAAAAGLVAGLAAVGVMLTLVFARPAQPGSTRHVRACRPDRPDAAGMCPEGCVRTCAPSCDMCDDCNGPGSCLLPGPGERPPHRLVVELAPNTGPVTLRCPSLQVRTGRSGDRLLVDLEGEGGGPCSLQFGPRADAPILEGIDPSARRCVVSGQVVTCE